MSEVYVPYEITAVELEKTDESTAIFVRSLFPDASDEQIAMVKLFATGKILDGICQGIELNDLNPMATIDAYKQGYRNGFDEGYVEATETLLDEGEV